MADLPKTVEQHSDEIDLTEVIRVLWDKKIWIILTTFVTTLLAGIYAFTAKEQWTSKATVIAPTSIELGDYLDIRREYNRILRTEQVDVASLAAGLFGNFKLLAQSSDAKNEFFQQSELYGKLIKDKTEEAQRTILYSLTNEAMKFVIPDPKKEPNKIGDTLSLYAEEPYDAQMTLGKFIDFISEKAFKLQLQEFLVDFQNLLTTLKYEKSLIQQDLSVNKSVLLENLNKAYQTAVKAGIKEYSKVLNEAEVSSIAAAALSDTKISLSDSQLAEGSYLFMLGEKYLKAQIDVAHQKGLVYPPRYYQIDYQIEQLEPLLEKVKTVKTKAYRYQASPDYPVSRDQPKRLIILLLGAIVGVILGGGIIFVRYFVIKK
ncbi:LPS O-antigen chain length determinant protein WzzB [Mannheimia indoligenes]|uniref:LPS O-antigen chain length determinant protein WzzB n=1 Tax=Mannheimia indoligenes TaxID=3103145 RepID=UPI002FE68A86